MNRLALSILALVAAAPLHSAPTAPAPPADPWARLAALRAGLAEEGERSADFTQTYTPAGFSAGETERGRFSISLPDCLRWDYTDPEPKSFLLCGRDVYSWSAGETNGRHARFDPRREAGLDLMLLAIDDLRRRYRAAAREREIDLEPTSAEAGLRSATLVLDSTGRRLTTIRYTDLDGNQTRFELSNWGPLVAKGAFEPPAGIAWSED